MAVKRPIVVEKKGRNTPANQRTPVRPAAAREVIVGPPEIATSSERTAAFDPRLLLTKLAAGKTSREYQADESVFSQGDAADAVFYIQSGKVKLTAVSKRGKEAVVATTVLWSASFSMTSGGGDSAHSG